MKPTTLALFLLVPGVVLAASEWGSLERAFPDRPCQDGWAGCMVGGRSVNADMQVDKTGRPLPSDLRVGWFDLEPTATFSPFVELSAYPTAVAALPTGLNVAATGDAPPVEAPPVETPPAEGGDAVAMAPDRTDSPGGTPPSPGTPISLGTGPSSSRSDGAALAPASSPTVTTASRPTSTPTTSPGTTTTTTTTTSSSTSSSTYVRPTYTPYTPPASTTTTTTTTPPTQTTAVTSASYVNPSATSTTQTVSKPATPTAPVAPTSSTPPTAGKPAAPVAPPPEPEPVADAGAQGCDDLLALEPAALMGQLSAVHRTCLEGRINAASRQTEKDRISRIMLMDAEARGDKEGWAKLAKRHLEDIDRSDPDLCFKYAIYLSKGGAGRAQGVIRWADYALENKSKWTGNTYTNRVSALLRLKAEGANKLWQEAEKAYVDNRNDENEAAALKYRGMTKNFAREWLDYARASGQPTNNALQLCITAAGNQDFCEGG